jgi:hypothetical protein
MTAPASSFFSLKPVKNAASRVKKILAGSWPENTTKKRIQFASDPVVKNIPTISDFSPDERNSIWMRKDDFRRAEEELKRCIKMILRHDLVHDTDVHSVRGTEEIVAELTDPEYVNQSKERTRAVLVEQDIQRSFKKENPEWLRQVAREKATRSAMIARLRGIQDEQEIQDYVQEERSLIASQSISTCKSSAVWGLQ